MRLVAGSVLVIRGFEGLVGHVAVGPPAALIARIALGLLIIAGLWTPVTGVLVAILEIALFAWRTGDPWVHLFLATIGVCLSLLGPGGWSVDARLFGWRRINLDIRNRPGRA
jgi:putative oxidoreductase